MRLIKTAPAGTTRADFEGQIRIDDSVCYDFVVSLRALFNPRTYARSRRWASNQLPMLGDDAVEKGKFLFAGFDTALGYGAIRVVPTLPEGAGPADLISALVRMPAGDLAMLMLDTGETAPGRLELFRQAIKGDRSGVDRALEGLPDGWAKRCARVLEEPDAVARDLVQVLDAHLSNVYRRQLPVVAKAIAGSTPKATALLDVLPAGRAIEQLTGGYSVTADLGLHTIHLAPSVFIYPFMSARVDESAGEALILYGISTDIFEDYDPVPMHAELLAALKAMADPSRLSVLRMLAEQPLYTVDLTRQLGLGQTTVHHHLAQLRAAGLIRQERDRHGMRYSIRTEEATEVLRALERWILGADQGSSNKEIS